MKVRIYQSGRQCCSGSAFHRDRSRIHAADYSPEQVEAWAGNPPDVERWCGQLTGRVIFVAEDDSEIVGFATLEPNGHLDHLYVHHRFQRQGIASALLRRIEEEAVSRGLNRIFTESSINARPFSEHFGFRLIAPHTVTVEGASLRNDRMEKFLA